MAKEWFEICAERLEEAANTELKAHYRYLKEDAPPEIAAPYKVRGEIYRKGAAHLLQTGAEAGDKPGG